MISKLNSYFFGEEVISNEDKLWFWGFLSLVPVLVIGMLFKIL